MLSINYVFYICRTFTTHVYAYHSKNLRKTLSFIIMKDFKYSTDIRNTTIIDLFIKVLKNSISVLSINNVCYVCRTCKQHI